MLGVTIRFDTYFNADENLVGFSLFLSSFRSGLACATLKLRLPCLALRYCKRVPSFLSLVMLVICVLFLCLLLISRSALCCPHCVPSAQFHPSSCGPRAGTMMVMRAVRSSN